MSKIVFLLSLLFFFFGCQSIKPVKTPEPLAIPSTYLSSTRDSTNIGQLPWRIFFEDEPELIRLVDIALKHNQNLMMAAQRINQARAEYVANKRLYLPNLDAGVYGASKKFGEYTMDGVGNFDTNFSENITEGKKLPDPYSDYFVGLESTWEIDIWGKLRGQKKSALARFLASEMSNSLLVTIVVAEVSSLYFDLLALDYEIEIINRNVKLQETAVELIMVQKATGSANELGVKQLKAQLLNTQTLINLINQEILEKENQLNLILGRFPQTIERSKTIDKVAIKESVSTGLPGDLLLNRPDVLAAEFELRAAQADVSVARAAFLPSFAITASGAYNSFSTEFLFSPGSIAWVVLGRLTTPVFHRNQLKANYKRKTAEQMAAFHSYQYTILNSYNEVSVELARLKNISIAHNLKKMEVSELSQAVMISNELFLTGYANYLEVVTAQKNVLSAEIELVRFKRDQLRAIVNLYRALGGGWDQ